MAHFRVKIRSWVMAVFLIIMYSPTAVLGVSSLPKWDCTGFLDGKALWFPVQVLGLVSSRVLDC
jgi:hypothetical protein